MSIRDGAVLASIGICFTLMGCDDNDKAAAKANEQAEVQRRVAAEHAQRQAEERARAAEERRLSAEKEAEDAKASKWAWIVGAAILGLVAGTAIAGKTKRDHEQQAIGVKSGTIVPDRRGDL